MYDEDGFDKDTLFKKHSEFEKRDRIRASHFVWRIEFYLGIISKDNRYSLVFFLNVFGVQTYVLPMSFLNFFF